MQGFLAAAWTVLLYVGLAATAGTVLPGTVIFLS